MPWQHRSVRLCEVARRRAASRSFSRRARLLLRPLCADDRAQAPARACRVASTYAFSARVTCDLARTRRLGARTARTNVTTRTNVARSRARARVGPPLAARGHAAALERARASSARAPRATRRTRSAARRAARRRRVARARRARSIVVGVCDAVSIRARCAKKVDVSIVTHTRSVEIYAGLNVTRIRNRARVRAKINTRARNPGPMHRARFFRRENRRHSHTFAVRDVTRARSALARARRSRREPRVDRSRRRRSRDAETAARRTRVGANLISSATARAR